MLVRLVFGSIRLKSLVWMVQLAFISAMLHFLQVKRPYYCAIRPDWACLCLTSHLIYKEAPINDMMTCGILFFGGGVAKLLIYT